jgi:hypothetical protein
MVTPLRARTTSPGRDARRPGMFSQRGRRATTLTALRWRAAACTAASTHAAPLMSPFMSAICAAGLSEIPPLPYRPPPPPQATP